MDRIVRLAVVFVLLQGCESCSCGSKPIQQEYCGSDFVILAVIDSVALTQNGSVWEPEPDNWDGVKYRMRDIRVLRGNTKYQEVTDKQHIHTAAYPSLCGAYFSDQTEHVIFGSVISGLLFTSACTRTKPWHWVIKKYRDDYITNLPSYCSQCQIVACTGSRFQPKCRKDIDHNKTCLMRDRRCALRAYCRKSDAESKCDWYHVMDGARLSCGVPDQIAQPEVVIPTLPTLPDTTTPLPVESTTPEYERNVTTSSVTTASVTTASVTTASSATDEPQEESNPELGWDDEEESETETGPAVETIDNSKSEERPVDLNLINPDV